MTTQTSEFSARLFFNNKRVHVMVYPRLAEPAVGIKEQDGIKSIDFNAILNRLTHLAHNPQFLATFRFTFCQVAEKAGVPIHLEPVSDAQVRPYALFSGKKRSYPNRLIDDNELPELLYSVVLAYAQGDVDQLPLKLNAIIWKISGLLIGYQFVTVPHLSCIKTK